MQRLKIHVGVRASPSQSFDCLVSVPPPFHLLPLFLILLAPFSPPAEGLILQASSSYQPVSPHLCGTVHN